jgi:hypothetical protein
LTQALSGTTTAVYDTGRNNEGALAALGFALCLWLWFTAQQHKIDSPSHFFADAKKNRVALSGQVARLDDINNIVYTSFHEQ